MLTRCALYCNEDILLEHYERRVQRCGAVFPGLRKVFVQKNNIQQGHAAAGRHWHITVT